MARLGRGRELERGGYRFEGWELRRRERQLIDPHRMPVSLTKGQYALLIAFLGAPHRPLDRKYLLQATHMHEDVFDRSVDVQVARLRRKLEPHATSPRLILAERGVGYVFACNVERY
jgi:two-component system, OmpR family, response regulator